MQKHGKTTNPPDQLASSLAQLRELSPKELREQWQSSFGAAPPPKLRAALIIQALAYRLQERVLGGLKPATLRLLARIAEEAAARRELSMPQAKARLRPGTVLIREWRGIKHQVTVLKDGFLYRTQRFRSLSEIARTITGSRWSGPRFFGLKSPRQEPINEAA
jgi:hypothetical protein